MEVFVDGVGGGSLVEEWGRWIRMSYMYWREVAFIPVHGACLRLIVP